MYDYKEGVTYKNLMREIKAWGDRIDEEELYRLHANARIQLRHDLITFTDDVHESWRGAMVTNIETMKAVHDAIRERNLHQDIGVSVERDLDRTIDAVRSWDKANGKLGETNE